jgi:hypothetical protein
MTLLLLFAGGSTAAPAPLVQPDTPTSRQVIPPLELRVYTIAAEVRSVTVPSDGGRIVTVDREEP